MNEGTKKTVSRMMENLKKQEMGVDDVYRQLKRLYLIHRYQGSSIYPQQSIAEHSWMVAALYLSFAQYYFDKYGRPFLPLSCSNYDVAVGCLLHDLDEVVLSDLPYFTKAAIEKEDPGLLDGVVDQFLHPLLKSLHHYALERIGEDGWAVVKFFDMLELVLYLRHVATRTEDRNSILERGILLLRSLFQNVSESLSVKDQKEKELFLRALEEFVNLRLSEVEE